MFRLGRVEPAGKSDGAAVVALVEARAGEEVAVKDDVLEDKPRVLLEVGLQAADFGGAQVFGVLRWRCLS
ncbi:MAG: hypothetical protein IPL39_18000 [Opitutaceae bacterium]|nr:hypothetical protein [Opitutaceae bacterium]